MTYFDATLEAGPIREQDTTPVLQEERYVFELVGFERSEPDQWRKEGGIRWTWRVFEADGKTPFVFQDEQYLFHRTTGLTRDGKPNMNVGTYANEWAAAMLGRDLGTDAKFSVSELRGKRMSAMVVWEPQRSDPKKKTIKLASLRHVPVSAQPATTTPSRAQDEATAAADKAIDDMERAAILADLATAIKTARKFGVPAVAVETFQAALDEEKSGTTDQLRAILENVKAENKKALDS